MKRNDRILPNGQRFRCTDLGFPTTVGQLRKLLEPYPDETGFGFRNQPKQNLHEILEGKETFVVFQ